MLKRLGTMSLATKTTSLALISLLLLSAIGLGVVLTVLSHDVGRRAADQQEKHMRIAWQVLRESGGKFHVEGDDLYLGTTRLNDWNAPVDTVKQLVGGTATVFLGDTRIATNVVKDDGSRAVGTKLAPGATYDAVLKRGEPFRGKADILGKSYYTAYDPIRDAEGKVVGVLYVGIPAAEVAKGFNALMWSLVVALGPVVLVIAAAMFFISTRMFRPLNRMHAAMERLAGGDTDIDIPGQGRADEIGRMASALASFRDSESARQAAEAETQRNHDEQAQVIHTLTNSLERLSGGDLMAEIRADFPESYAALKTNFNTALRGLRELIGSVIEATGAIRNNSTEIARASEDLARRSESNAASLEQTSAAVTQMNDRLAGSARSAASTVERADAAISAVDSGRGVADVAMQAMGRVSESAKGIDSVIEGLDKIAFQTRVLAMNAAVEAGRAGEAGRGFAVVADLVSALAMRAEEEAKRAREQLIVTQSDVATAESAVRNVDESLGRIVATVGEVHTLLAAMAEDNRHQSSAIGEISTAIHEMDRSTQQTAAMVEETSAAAMQLRGQVNGLAERAGEFNIDAQPSATIPIAARPAEKEGTTVH